MMCKALTAVIGIAKKNNRTRQKYQYSFRDCGCSVLDLRYLPLSSLLSFLFFFCGSGDSTWDSLYGSPALCHWSVIPASLTFSYCLELTRGSTFLDTVYLIFNLQSCMLEISFFIRLAHLESSEVDERWERMSDSGTDTLQCNERKIKALIVVRDGFGWQPCRSPAMDAWVFERCSPHL